MEAQESIQEKKMNKLQVDIDNGSWMARFYERHGNKERSKYSRSVVATCEKELAELRTQIW